MTQLTNAQPGLEATFSGELIASGHPDYDDARGLYNGMFDKRPALIARCTSAIDVQAALAYARERNLIVAVRGGGHSTPGHSSCDGGIVIDTGPMKSVAIDAKRHTGRFGAGLTWGELDAATQEHGLAVTGGRVTHTGIAGLTLGSGSGWLERKYGPTCANLISAEVVTADGRILRASAGSERRAALGPQGRRRQLRRRDRVRVPPAPGRSDPLRRDDPAHPRAVANDLARCYRDFMADASDEIAGGLALLTAPPEEFVPAEARGKPACALIVIYLGDPRHGEEALRPLLDWGEPWVKLVQPMPYAAVQGMIDAGHPWGISEYAKMDYLRELPDEAIDAMAENAAEASSPFTKIYLCPLGGAVSRMDRNAMALGIPDTPWMYFCLAEWWDPTMKAPEIAWARAFMTAMRPWSVDQAPANFIEPDEGIARLRASYGDEKFKRLVALKDKYDPEHACFLNPNIPPSQNDHPRNKQHARPTTNPEDES